MTGRRAARDHEDRPTGPAVDDEPAPDPAPPRSAGVAPQPRLVPGTGERQGPSPRPSPTTRADPPEDQQTRPSELAATPARPTPAAPTPTRSGSNGQCVEVRDRGAGVDVRDSKAPEAGLL
ncbi:DUF397 domain-containing protein, partial [Micromonospora chokoriensis]